jgi:hypothetical protein
MHCENVNSSVFHYLQSCNDQENFNPCTPCIRSMVMNFEYIFIDKGTHIILPVHEMKAHRVIEAHLHLFLITALHGVPVTLIVVETESSINCFFL